MKIRISALLTLCLFLFLPVYGKDKWTKVQSKHFTLVGNASEKDIRTVGTKLEQFRSVFSQMFPRTVVDSKERIDVIVFKSKSAFIPFMPARNGRISEVAGYFQAGEDVSYIALTSEFGENDPYAVIFHEYLHSLTSKTMGDLPLWLNEGLAEYYSTLKVTDKDTHVLLGSPISHSIYTLRDTKVLPLQWLFSVAHESKEYNEGDKRGIFYAESWALIHYLMLGDNGRRRPQFQKFVGMLMQGVPAEQAFPKAFETDFKVIEKELSSYVGKTSFAALNYKFDSKLTFDDEMTTTEVSEAEANFYLGDLLAHSRRADSEKYLQASIKLDPEMDRAYATLGFIRNYAGKYDEALDYLEKAVRYDKTGNNHLTYFYYAQALMKEGNAGRLAANNLDKAKAAKIRENLQKAILINPTFLPAYSLYGFLAAVTREGLDDAAMKLKGILVYAPGDQNCAVQLGQVYLHLEKFDEATKIFLKLVNTAKDDSIRKLAQSQLEYIQQRNDYLARMKLENERREKEFAERKREIEEARVKRNSASAPAGEVVPETPSRPTIQRRTGGGESVTGQMTKLECNGKGVTVYLTVGTEKLRFHTNTPEKLQFTTFTQAQNEEIACIDFSPSRLIRVVYKPMADPKSDFAGEPLAIEFIKPEDR